MTAARRDAASCLIGTGVVALVAPARGHVHAHEDQIAAAQTATAIVIAVLLLLGACRLVLARPTRRPRS